MTSIVQHAIDRYESRMPNAREARLTDPHYAYQAQVLRETLEIADMAMEDEGIPESSRRRVVSTILYGGPSEADAILREHQQAQFRRAMFATPPSMTFPMGEAPKL